MTNMRVALRRFPHTIICYNIAKLTGSLLTPKTIINDYTHTHTEDSHSNSDLNSDLNSDCDSRLRLKLELKTQTQS